MDTNRDQLCVSPLRLKSGIHTHALKSTRASIRGITDHAGINYVYDRFGSVPRLFVDIFGGKADQFEDYNEDVHKAISNITLEYLARLFEDASLPLPFIRMTSLTRSASSAARIGIMWPVSPLYHRSSHRSRLDSRARSEN